jgi:hypothetical protein
MPAPDTMSREQPARLVDTLKAPVILDLRREGVRATDPRMLVGAAGLGLALHLAGFT